MDIMELEQVVKNIDRRLSRIEQILPTLATKGEISTLATKAELSTLATKADLSTLATKAEISTLATKAEISTLATKAEISRLATKAELREEGERTRQQFNAVAERIEAHVRLVAEGHVTLERKLEGIKREYDRTLAQIDRRVMRLEAR